LVDEPEWLLRSHYRYRVTASLPADARAVLFDLDGVLTPTADVHMRAWGQLFTDVLGARDGQAPYTDADYFDHVDGKPRSDGVRDLLTARGITLPEGSPDDAPDQDTVNGLGTRKNLIFASILESEGVQPYPGSVPLLDALAERGVGVAVVSSSRNAPAVLAAAGIADRFEVVVDGAVAAELGLPGKPAPDTFLHAARQLGVPAAACVVVEDALSGVQAGAAGGFAMVVGVDRGAGEKVLRDAGADLVVRDVGELLS
jgi:beta-phosphoglucomutase family hydrolase